MNTNYIRISKRRAYLIPFVEKVLKKDDDNDVKFANGLLDLVKTLVKTAPASYQPQAEKPDNSISFELPKWKNINTEYRFYISRAAGRVIEGYIYKMFNLILEIHIEKLNKFSTRKDAIYLFLEMYNIDLDYFETLNKKAYRKKTSILPKKTAKITSAFSVFLSFACPLLFFLVL